jgi:hypothetical protein
MISAFALSVLRCSAVVTSLCVTALPTAPHARKTRRRREHEGPLSQANAERVARLLEQDLLETTAVHADERHQCCDNIQLGPDRVADSPLAAERHNIRPTRNTKQMCVLRVQGKQFDPDKYLASTCPDRSLMPLPF